MTLTIIDMFLDTSVKGSAQKVTDPLQEFGDIYATQEQGCHNCFCCTHFQTFC